MGEGEGEGGGASVRLGEVWSTRTPPRRGGDSPHWRETYGKLRWKRRREEVPRKDGHFVDGAGGLNGGGGDM